MKPISRREMIGSSLTAAAAWFSTSTARSLFGEPLVAVPGIQLYTVDKELKANVQSTLEKVRAIGYKEVETAGFAGLSPKAFRSALENAGLICQSSHFFNFGSGDLDQILEAANDLGVRYIVSSGMSPFMRTERNSVAKLEDFKAMGDFCNTIGKRAKEAGLQFAYHNHNFEFQVVGTVQVGYDVLLEQTDPEFVKLELDCGWMMAAGQDPIRYFAQFPNRYRLIHIKDFVKPAKPSTSLAPQEVPQGTALGDGYIDYKPILKAAKAAGVEHFYVEQEPPFIGMSAMEAAARDFRYLHSLSM